MKHSPPAFCPVCGTEVPRSALACPECGADDTAGWNENGAVYDGVDLPEEQINYDEYVKREFGGDKPPKASEPGIMPWLWIAGFLLAALVLGFLLRR